MATSDQLKALIKSHFDDHPERFKTTALQIAAHEAKKGHSTIASEIRTLVDSSNTKIRKLKTFNRELEGLVLEYNVDHKLTDLIAHKSIRDRIERVLNEYKQKEKLKKHGLLNRRKILLTGPPGTGKTMTASIVARELNLPLYVTMMDKVVTKFMGESSSKLRQIFDMIEDQRGVYLFDEFDAIGTDRKKENDVGEMRRVLNSFLQFIEVDNSESIIIAATNNLELLDKALFRRFDDVLKYSMPTQSEITSLLENRLGVYNKDLNLNTLSKLSKSLSHSDISQAVTDAIKKSVLSDKNHVIQKDLASSIKEKLSSYNHD